MSSLQPDVNQPDLKDFLDEKFDKYNRPEFIESDPVQIPHLFSDPNDIEISAFLAATIAWGQRPTIIKNMARLMSLMDNAPHDFVVNCSRHERERFRFFVHRTFNGTDCIFFLESLQNIYKNHGGLGELFQGIYLYKKEIKETLSGIRKTFFEIDHPKRTEKHFADVLKGASAKRLNMFLRWMVRNDKRGVDFGLWNKIPASALYLPLDVHSGNVARKLGLLKRKQNDWQAVEEVTSNLRILDANDPVKYDFALFGLGIFEKF
ncbi:MAG: TIGR02757 family protein [Bacteroidetes bacterium GWC2_33_15]|nr:MAG: TIGR02757 family protein [Bacteroidetes bacterium GWC2_33_15]OFX65312.1 MAG: TIGR02757 family protein [Bacteroidetes bacterium GWB2_32_14]OFX70539.1 MAG: TIGR02757 family protein [Bacteroidetes bacterium GWD2_33_33]HAN19587.1 TIGR02757 family protein [Bacteroidales bacterium]